LVADCAAHNDNTTHDFSSAFTQCWTIATNLTALGQYVEIRVPCGFYIADNPISLTNPAFNIAVRGEGMFCAHIRYTSTGTFITLSSDAQHDPGTNCTTYNSLQRAVCLIQFSGFEIAAANQTSGVIFDVHNADRIRWESIKISSAIGGWGFGQFAATVNNA